MSVYTNIIWQIGDVINRQLFVRGMFGSRKGYRTIKTIRRIKPRPQIVGRKLLCDYTIYGNESSVCNPMAYIYGIITESLSVKATGGVEGKNLASIYF